MDYRVWTVTGQGGKNSAIFGSLILHDKVFLSTIIVSISCVGRNWLDASLAQDTKIICYTLGT